MALDDSVQLSKLPRNNFVCSVTPFYIISKQSLNLHVELQVNVFAAVVIVFKCCSVADLLICNDGVHLKVLYCCHEDTYLRSCL